MLTNYLKIARRNLWRNKAFSTINILGLAVGLATCMLILMFVQHELSYDSFNEKASRIYRLTFHATLGPTEVNVAAAPAPAGAALVRELPDFEAVTRISSQGSFIVKHGQTAFKEERVAFVDSNFFDIFSIAMKSGNARTALLEPKTMVISEAMARKYFGNNNPVAQSLQMGTGGLFRITGVSENVPSNAHFHYDFFCSMKSTRMGEKWLSSGAHTYLLVREGVSMDRMKTKMQAIIRKYVGPEIQEFLGYSYDEHVKKGDTFDMKFQPLTDIHLKSNFEDELEGNGNVKSVYIFSAIAAFILLIACINFMNLSTAGSANRAKEVGVRKVMGSVQTQLIWQFLTESVLLTFLALIVAFTLVLLVLPNFNQLAGKDFSLVTFLNVKVLGLAFLGCLTVGILAGSYPAFFLSSFRPVSVLKGKLQMGAKSGWLRNSLVTVQFVVSIVMIVATIVVYQQLQFIQNKKLGFNKEQVLILHDTYVLGDKLRTFKEQLAALAPVSKVSLAGYLPAGASNSGRDGFVPADGGDHTSPFRQRTFQIDEDYLPTLGIQLVAGRNFSREFADSSVVMMNEAAVKEYGWKDAVGKQIKTLGDGRPGSKRTYTVIGVTKDFHYESMHEAIAPLVMYYGGDGYQMAVRLKTNNIPATLGLVEKIWKSQTDNPFAYSFLNDRFNKMYLAEQRAGQLFGIFASLAVIIACLGLFGLVAFTTVQRTKEIGVRKVLGASVMSIVSLLSIDFVKLVAIAMLIAAPLAWYGMNQWLRDFAYRIELTWWTFALAGLIALAVAVLTVSFESIKAALVNPVRSLGSE